MGLEVVELGRLTEQDWTDLVGGEHEPFGPMGAGLEWRPKDRHVALRARDGGLVAVAGAVWTTATRTGTAMVAAMLLGRSSGFPR